MKGSEGIIEEVGAKGTVFVGLFLFLDYCYYHFYYCFWFVLLFFNRCSFFSIPRCTLMLFPIYYCYFLNSFHLRIIILCLSNP